MSIAPEHPQPPPPPYTLLDCPSPRSCSNVALLHDQIPLLSLAVDYPPSGFVSSHPTDQHSQRILRLAMRDYKRQQSPAEWGKYRHGQLLSASSSSSWMISGEEFPGVMVRGLVWLVGFLAPPEDLMSGVAWRGGAGILAGVNRF
ncbi:hypothetical protein IAU59_000941 [Kwoniella sp. CBS 9459]